MDTRQGIYDPVDPKQKIMKIQMSVGRGSKDRPPEELEVAGFAGMVQAVKKRLMSSIIEIVEMEDDKGNGTGTYDVMVGDLSRTVGWVKVLDFKE